VKYRSLRFKLVLLGIGLQVLLAIALFAFHYQNEKERVRESYIEKARVICNQAESVREGMEEKWRQGLFNSEMLRAWAESKEFDKVLASVPVVSAWEAAQKKATEGGYEFRTPKHSARNSLNEPNPIEAQALEAMEKENLSEWHTIDAENNAVRYFRPVRLTESCLLCHGDPATSEAIWGLPGGKDPTGGTMEGWKVGEIHGAFEVIQSLDQADAQLMASMQWAGALIIGSLFLTGVIFALFVIRYVERPISVISEKLLEGAELVAAASKQVADSSLHVASGASEQASSLEETSASLELMASMIRQNSNNARQATGMANSAREAAHEGRQAMGKMSDAIHRIKGSSDETAKIIKSIDEIAFQTNLLALNAAVEAARAGDAGKGFAVVAEEVRNLAKRCADAARSTSNLIEEAQQNAESGVNVSGEVGTKLDAISTSIEKVSHLIEEVATASTEQSQGIDQINHAMSQMDTVTQANAAVGEQAAAASQQLTGQAYELNVMIAGLLSLVSGEETATAASRRRALPSPLTDLRSTGSPSRVNRAVERRNETKLAPPARLVKRPEEVIALDEEDFKDF